MSTANIDKILIENTDIWGFEHAMRGMRNPMNSWDKNDTVMDKGGFVFVGDNDLKLATNLCKSGPEHRKYLRMIHVSVDLTLPRYIWSELDTYHFNIKNSCSTMHRLLNNKSPITEDLFVYNNEDKDLYNKIFDTLENMRLAYINPKSSQSYKDLLLVRAKRLLPEGFLQKRTFDTNYEELRNIYHQRKSHRLKEEWGIICKWISELPYANELLLS